MTSFNLSDITSKTKKVAFDFDGQTANLEVRSYVITPNFITNLSAFKEDKSATDQQITDKTSEILCQLIASWDVVWNGEALPLDPGQLKDIPLVFQSACIDAAIKSMGEAKAPAA